MDLFPLFLLLLSGKVEVFGAQLQLLPVTLTVLRGDEARFTCSTSSQWTVMVWMLNGRAELTISRVTGVLPSLNPNVTAEESPNSKGDSWVFVLRSTERYNQGQVTCDLQGITTKTASLFVQEMGSVRVLGDDKLAFKGQCVQFECEATGWHPQPILQWKVNDKMVSVDEYNISSEETGKSLFTVTSNLSVMAAMSSHVDCLASVSALATPLKSSTRLTVVAEVVQEDENDCTVLVAVTASLSALLLLVLLCICTVLYYRQRRQAKANPREVIRIEHPVFGNDSFPEAPEGKINLAYSSEAPTDASYNELTTETRSQVEFVSFHKVPDVVSSKTPSIHSEGQAKLCLTEESPKNIRRITTV